MFVRLCQSVFIDTKSVSENLVKNVLLLKEVQLIATVYSKADDESST